MSGETENVFYAYPRASRKPIPNYLKPTLSSSGLGASCHYPNHQQVQASPSNASCAKVKGSIGGVRTTPSTPERINPKIEKSLPKAGIKSKKAEKAPPMQAETIAKRRKVPTGETSTTTKPTSISRKLSEEKLPKIPTHAKTNREEEETAREQTKENKYEESEQNTPEASSTTAKNEEKIELPNITSAPVPTTTCHRVEEVATEPRHSVKALAGAFQGAVSSLQQPMLLTRCGSKFGGGQFGRQPTGVELKGGKVAENNEVT